MISDDQIKIFQDLFKGREDVYARRWEKEGKAGYMPAYEIDWNEYQKFKLKGGLFKDYKDKRNLLFNKNSILEHLTGKYTVGIYPLLDDNTSYWIAADFDKEHWQDECLNFLQTCQKYNIPAYLERSRSGNGGHVWIFFADKYLALKSRKIIFEILRESFKISPFDKEVSFDRLFPNQDSHSGKGYGNLIALPLNANSLEKGNSAFINIETFLPYPDQWNYISNINKLKISELETLYQSFFKPDSSLHVFFQSPQTDNKLLIKIQKEIKLQRVQLQPTIIKFLRDNLNFLNTEYLIKKNIGKSVFNTEKYFKLIEETENEIIIPRGFANKLIKFCQENNISYIIEDERKLLPKIELESTIQLFQYQQQIIEKILSKNFGVIVAPPGSGKTVIGLELITQKQQPALILVHRKQLLDQWIERIESFLNIPKKEIGQIGSGKIKIGKQITIGMLQSLAKVSDFSKLSDSFGIIIVDECHHIPAKTFREIITKLNSFYLYGLTATPKRKKNDEKLIYVFIGEIIAELKTNEITEKKVNAITVNIIETGLSAPFDYRIDNYETISKILVFDTARNLLIINQIANELLLNRKILLLTERKEHIEVLNLYLKEKYETITISGDDSEISKKSKLAQIKSGHFQVVLSTGQFFGEGMDIDSLDCLFLVYPFAFEGKLVQYIGRIQRSENPPIIYDFRDSKIDYFEKLFKQRNRYYKKLEKQNA